MGRIKELFVEGLEMGLDSDDIMEMTVEELEEFISGSYRYSYSGLASFKQVQLEKEITTLQERITNQTKELQKSKDGVEERNQKLEKLQESYNQLKTKESLRHLLDRVCLKAQDKLLSTKTQMSELFGFDENEVCEAYVISIDVRRSTELMLKARNAKDFARFITTLANKLREVIIKNYGVFDKFTGDGILAYFPVNYSGQDAGLRVANAANECHKIFAEHYKESRKYFTSVLNDVGLGIGVDFGKITIVKMHVELTIVGTPVVYACRLGGADAGETLVNQPAYEVLMEKFSECVDFTETSIHFKHEGNMLAYKIERNSKKRSLEDPTWLLENVEDAKTLTPTPA